MAVITWDAGNKEHPPTDFENPVRDGGTNMDPHYRVTVCDNASFGRWRLFKGLVERDQIEARHVGGSDEYVPAPVGGRPPVVTKGEVRHDDGTDGKGRYRRACTSEYESSDDRRRFQ